MDSFQEFCRCGCRPKARQIRETADWVNPTSALAGVLAVGVCAYLAAVLLCADALRDGSAELAAEFRHASVGNHSGDPPIA